MNLPLDRAQAPNGYQHHMPTADCCRIWPQEDAQAVCFKVNSHGRKTKEKLSKMRINKLIVVMVATSAVQDAGMSSRLLCMVSTLPPKKISPLSWTHGSLAQVLEVLRSSASCALPGSHEDELSSPHPSSPVRGPPRPGLARKLGQRWSVLPYVPHWLKMF